MSQPTILPTDPTCLIDPATHDWGFYRPWGLPSPKWEIKIFKRIFHSMSGGDFAKWYWHFKRPGEVHYVCMGLVKLTPPTSIQQAIKAWERIPD